MEHEYLVRTLFVMVTVLGVCAAFWKGRERDAKAVWESLGEFTYRMKVPGGWIVRTEATYYDPARDNWNVAGVAMCFVPDPRHGWNTGTDTE